jgi:hypothetical protein
VYGTSAGRMGEEVATVEIDDDVIAHPNPVQSILNVKADGYKGGIIKIMDAGGREHITSTFNENAVDVSMLPSGLYIIRLSKEKKSAVKKFMKQ